MGVFGDVVTKERGRTADFLLLTKPRLALLVLFTVLAGYCLAPVEAFAGTLLVHALLATALVAGGANAINMWIEREHDARMVRTCGRPLATGRLRPGEVLLFGTAIAAAGVAWLALFVNPRSSAVAAVTLLSYVAVYTPMKRLTALNTVVGAVPGALPPLIGYTAAGGALDARAMTLFAIVFLWQLPHFLAIAWIHRDDYARGGFVMLPAVDPGGSAMARQIVVHSLELLLVSLLPTVLGHAGRLYFFGALVLGVLFLGCGVLVAIRRSEAAARRHFYSSLVYLPLLFLLMMLDRVAP
jgi:protoheme IX farnesyltransferase